jgi:hypothetical protein
MVRTVAGDLVSMLLAIVPVPLAFWGVSAMFIIADDWVMAGRFFLIGLAIGFLSFFVQAVRLGQAVISSFEPEYFQVYDEYGNLNIASIEAYRGDTHEVEYETDEEWAANEAAARNWSSEYWYDYDNDKYAGSA